jgi:hypothetical protein
MLSNKYIKNKTIKIWGATELVAGNLSLQFPGLAVDVEDALAEEVFEGLVEIGSLAVVVEVGFEDVLDDVWVGG